jgi:hypothetical protein
MGINLAAIRSRYEKLKRGDTSRYKPPTGTSILRIVAFKHAGGEYVYVAGKQHWGVLKFSKSPFDCPHALFGGDCAVDAMEEMVTNDDPASFNPADLEMMKKWDTRDVVYFNVFDWKHQELGCQIWPASKSLSVEIMGLIAAEDALGRPMYPEMCSPTNGIDIILTNSGTGFDRYAIAVATAQEGDIIRVIRRPLPENAKPVDLFAYVKAPSYAWTEAALIATKKEELPESGAKSKIDMLGEPEASNPGWYEYFQTEGGDGGYPGASPAEQPVEAAAPAPQAGGASVLQRLKAGKRAQPAPPKPEIPPTTTGDAREPLLDENGNLPWCCGYANPETGELEQTGEWVGEQDPACVQCLAAEICKECSTVTTGLEPPFDATPEPEPPAQPAKGAARQPTKAAAAAEQTSIPGFPAAEAAAARAASASKAGANKSSTKSTAAAPKAEAGKTNDILARLKAKKNK